MLTRLRFRDVEPAVALEFPGVVADADTALAALDPARVAREFAQDGAGDARLALSVRPSPPGVVQPTSGVLVRLKRRRGEVSAAPLLRVHKMMRFRGMVDYAPPSSAPEAVADPLVAVEQAAMGQPPTHDGVVSIMPSLFSSVRDPSPSPAAWLSVKPAAPRAKKARKTSTGAPKVTQIALQDPTPPRPPAGAVQAAGELAVQLEGLFEQVKVWSLTCLQDATGAQPNELRHSLAHVAYQFVSGPWKHLYVQLSWDPRVRPSEARAFQAYTVRLSKDKITAIRQKHLDTTDPKARIEFLGGELKASSTRTYFEMKHGQVHRALTSHAARRAFDAKHGWMSESGAKAVKQAIVQALQDVEREGPVRFKASTEKSNPMPIDRLLRELRAADVTSGPEGPRHEAVSSFEVFEDDEDSDESGSGSDRALVEAIPHQPHEDSVDV